MLQENTPTIETTRLRLRKFTPADVEDFFVLMKDPVVNRFLPWVPLQTVEQAAAFLQERYISCYSLPSAYRYAICLKDTDRVIGYVGLGTAPAHDFGYCLRQEYWNQGITTEAAAAVLDRIAKAGYGFVTATHDVENPGSGAVMGKIGMTYRYSYVEQWQPKDIAVTFRMYQCNFDGSDRTYLDYWNTYTDHFIEDLAQ